MISAVMNPKREKCLKNQVHKKYIAINFLSDASNLVSDLHQIINI